MIRQLRQFLRAAAGDDGQALVEYALILALVSIASIAMLTTLGGDIGTLLTSVSTAIQAA